MISSASIRLVGSERSHVSDNGEYSAVVISRSRMGKAAAQAEVLEQPEEPVPPATMRDVARDAGDSDVGDRDRMGFQSEEWG